MDDCGGYRALPFVAEFYDHIQAYHDPLSQVFYRGLARAAGGPVLELGCGTGRLLLPMARTGAPATGLDLSEAMLSQCRARLAHEPPEVQARVHLVHGDMRDFSLPRPFRLVTIPFLTFMHLLTVEEQLACLVCAHRHLATGGRLALDVFNPDLRALTDARMGEEGPEEPPFLLDDGRSVTRRFRDASVDLHRQVLHAEIIYAVTHPDGRRERLVHAFPYRYFFRYELEHHGRDVSGGADTRGAQAVGVEGGAGRRVRATCPPSLADQSDDGSDGGYAQELEAHNPAKQVGLEIGQVFLGGQMAKLRAELGFQTRRPCLDVHRARRRGRVPGRGPPSGPAPRAAATGQPPARQSEARGPVWAPGCERFRPPLPPMPTGPR